MAVSRTTTMLNKVFATLPDHRRTGRDARYAEGTVRYANL